MSIFENFEKKLQAEPKSIVFTEGTDARILSAASRLLAGKTLKVILLGEVEAVKKAAADGSFDITGAEIIDPTNYAGFDEMVAKMVELRKGKMTDEQCRAALSKGNYFGTMLVKMGKADCLLGGKAHGIHAVQPQIRLAHSLRCVNVQAAAGVRLDDLGNLLDGRSSHFCADVGYDFPALLHDGRHRRGSASERRLDDFCAGSCRYRISAAGWFTAGVR